MGSVSDVQDVDSLGCDVDHVNDAVDVGFVSEEELAAERIFVGCGMPLRVCRQSCQCSGQTIEPSPGGG